MQHIKQSRLWLPKVKFDVNLGISPAIFLSPFYMKKGDYSMEVYLFISRYLTVISKSHIRQFLKFVQSTSANMITKREIKP